MAHVLHGRNGRCQENGPGGAKSDDRTADGRTFSFMQTVYRQGSHDQTASERRHRHGRGSLLAAGRAVAGDPASAARSRVWPTLELAQLARVGARSARARRVRRRRPAARGDRPARTRRSDGRDRGDGGRLPPGTRHRDDARPRPRRRRACGRDHALRRHGVRRQPVDPRPPSQALGDLSSRRGAAASGRSSSGSAPDVR